MAAALAAVWPATSDAATAPAKAPVLTSAPYAFPFTIHWTPGAELNVSQSVYRSTGPCTTPLAAGGLIITLPGNTTTDYTGRPADGTYCYYIKVADLTGGTADSPGVTLSVDTMNPTATVAVSGQGPGGVVAGTVNVSPTSSDAVSGVASSVLHVGGAGACPSSPVIGSAWDTTALANGIYDVCNVVTDNAGHVATATVAVTVANPPPPPSLAPVKPAAPASGTPLASLAGPAGADSIAPLAPSKLSVILPRSHIPEGIVRVTLHWVKPSAPDLGRVVVVLNLKRSPRGPADGSKVYSGLGTSVALKLRAGQTGYVALFAYDHSGNVSHAARKVVSLAALIPLRPLTGSVVRTAPVLTWKAKAGTTYYNVQLFRNGRRVLVGWPSGALYRVPAGWLVPGTYVWFVWPAVKAAGAAPTFGDLIGRATFVYSE
jgi:hypothetical protein